ncbi:phage regulatory CII family protein [Salinarimonas sp. NSM]|uniref:phage regulatory CII family protein n=1 Tax=Salinarimonas sp. NSM TaxID=3458003 RepID=UPI0040364D2D
MNDRPTVFPESAILALKAATRRAAECAGGVTYVSQFTTANTGLLSRYGSASETLTAPLGVAIVLDAKSGLTVPPILQQYAALFGFDLVPSERAEPSVEHFARHLGDVATASGALVREIGEAVADGHVDHVERRRIHEAAEALAQEVAEVAADTDPDRIVPRRG